MATPFTKDMNIITNFAKDMDIIASLDDQPNDIGGLTAAELKAKFDEGGKAIQEYINNVLIPEVLGLDATESTRQANETLRISNEESRTAAEKDRALAEAVRVASEVQRVSAEDVRNSAETARNEAEQSRVNETAGIVAQASTMAQIARVQSAAAEASAAEAERLAQEVTTHAAAVADNAAQANTDAATASSAATAAQSWAVGDTGTRADEDVNNAKFWAQQAQRMATGGGSGKKSCRFVIGTSAAGWMEADCDYLCDGVNDQEEINAAIQALPENGGEILILDGTYSLNGSIVMKKPSTTLNGCGSATILQADYESAIAPMLELTADNCLVRSMCLNAKFDRWKDSRTIVCRGKYCTIDHVDGLNSLYFLVADADSDYCRISNCNMLDHTANAVTIDGNFSTVAQCLVHYIGITGSDCIVAQNVIDGLDTVEPMECQGARNVFVGNRISVNANSVIFNSKSTENLITGNILSGITEIKDSGTNNVAANNIFTA